jgi:hypothetical protein
MDQRSPLDPVHVLDACLGRRLVAASSSLTYLSLGYDDGHGLLVEARPTEGAACLRVERHQASDLPTLAEAVCAVDWSWIAGSALRAARLAEAELRLELEPAGPLTISAALWQGAPFLAFQPYRAPQ